MKSLLLTALAIITLSCGLAARHAEPQRGKLVDQWETSNGGFRVRVGVFAEADPVWLQHFHYVVEATQGDVEEWCEVLSARLDDDVPIPKEQFRFLNDETAYFYIYNKYAVTVDGSRTWSVWDAGENVRDCAGCGRPYIKEVSIWPDGSGVMKLTPRLEGGGITELHTRDFGLRWEESMTPAGG